MNYFRDCTSDESSCNIHYILFVYSRQCVSTNGYRCVLNKQNHFWKQYIIVGNAFLVQQRNSKCISNTKKFVNDNLSSTNGYQNRISHFHCNLQVEIAAYFSSVPKRCKHCEFRFCKRRRIYLAHYLALFKLVFLLSLFSVPFQVQTFMTLAKVSSLKCAVFYLYMACTYLCSCIHYNLHKKQMSFCQL